MPRLNFSLLWSLLGVLLGVASLSCSENDVSSTTDTETDTGVETDSDSEPLSLNGVYIQQMEPLRSWTQDEIQTAFSLFQLQVPDVADLSETVKYDVKVYKMTYQTTYNNAPVTASALAAFPQTDVAIPVLGFQNGTNTEYASAPTETADSIYMRILTSIASFGYAVVIPDYLGFGESTQIFHPYLCKEITAQTLADMLQATVEFEESQSTNLTLSGDLFLMGYSQGGHATMALHEYLNGDETFPLVLQAVAAGAGPYDLAAINNHILTVGTYDQPYYSPYTILAFQSLGYISDDLSKYFAAPYSSTIPTLYNGQNDSEVINGQLTTDMTSLYSASLLTAFASEAPITDDNFDDLRAAFEANSVAPFASAVPLRLSHGSSDTSIPPSSSQAFYQGFVDAGTPAAQVEYVEFPDLDHQGAAPYAITNAVQWFNEMNGY